MANLFSLFQELERHKHTCTVLQHKQEELKEGIRQRDELIEVTTLSLEKKKLQSGNIRKVLVPVCRPQWTLLGLGTD